MTLSWQTPGAVSQGSTVASPAYPATPALGELLVLLVGWGNLTDTTPATPTGFYAPPNNTWLGGTGSWGIDLGNRGVTVFCRIADGTETGNVTVNNGSLDATSVISAQIMRITKTDPAFYVSVTGGTDNTSGTGYSATGAVALIPRNGDIGITVTAWEPDTATSGTPTLTWDGVATTTTAVQSIANSNGNDVRFIIVRRTLAGNGGSAPVLATTAGAAAAGPTAFVLVKEGPAAKRYVGNLAAIRRASTY